MSGGEHHLGEHRLACNLLVIVIFDQKLEWMVKLLIFAIIHHKDSVSVNYRYHSMRYDQNGRIILRVIKEFLSQL